MKAFWKMPNFEHESPNNARLIPPPREMQMLDQLENLLIEVEKAPKENTPTMKAFIVLARAVYYLMRERCR